jgi:hypothetical protein
MEKGKFTIGTDPEFFMIEKGSGKFKSSIPFIKGTKESPEIMECGAGLHRDNVALEIASVPAADELGFVSGIRTAFANMMKRLPKGHDVTTDPSASFDKDQLNHPEALEFGCDEDYDAWSVAVNQKQSCSDETFRSCGGHVHLGYVKGSGNDFLLDPYGKIDVVRTMDAILGTVSVILDNSEGAIKRRRLYGKAGCQRPTEYGVEYRVLSNFWLKSPELVMLTYRLSSDVLRVVREGAHDDLINLMGGGGEIASVINDGDVETARKLVNDVVLPILSEESRETLNECLIRNGEYEFKKEWKCETQTE